MPLVPPNLVSARRSIDARSKRYMLRKTVLLLLLATCVLAAKRTRGVILADIKNATPTQENSDYDRRLKRELGNFRVFVMKAQKKKRPLTKESFRALWEKASSEKKNEKALQEVILKILEIPMDALLKEATQLQLIQEVPGSTRGCCAIQAHYQFNHEKIRQMPDFVVLAFFTRTTASGGGGIPWEGLHHGTMIEMVDRGYIDSYRGYQCKHNAETGCRTTVQ